MMLKSLLLILTISFAAQANEVPTTLNNLSGCFEVQFQFVEDGDFDKTYRPIYEYIRIKEGEENVYEHIGQYPLYDSNGNPLLGRDGKPRYMVQYHWREHWEQINGNQWKQTVYGPFNDFRYECEGKWLMNQFHCHTDRAAKPRRDMKRPYDYMMRINNLQINPKRWVHSSRNKKMMNDDSLYSVEMGWNTYTRVEDAKCQPAIDSNAQPLKP
jgi:hypothetical protein